MDRHGSGDLTVPEAKVVSEKKDVAEGKLHFKVGDIHDGKLTHKGLAVYVTGLEALAEFKKEYKELLAKNPKARGYVIGMDVEMPGWRGARAGDRVYQHVARQDVNGFLQFADKRQDAPIIHFGGPWQITLDGRHTLVIGREKDLSLAWDRQDLGQAQLPCSAMRN